MNRTRAQGRHAGLTRHQVLQTAVQLVDRDGAAALSMRKLAKELDVEAMTLYHHVRNKQALEDAIVEHVMTEALARCDTDAPWRQVLAAYGCALHRGLLDHPGAVPFFASRPAVTPTNLAHVEAVLTVLCKAGFGAAHALLIVQTLAATVVGQHLALPADPGGDDLALAAETLGEFPLFAEALEAGLPGVASRVTFAVDSLIAGLEEPVPAGE